MGYVLTPKHSLMEGQSTSNLNSWPHIITYDDWSYELGINEFEKEEKTYIRHSDKNDNNKDGGNGCVVFIILAIITAFAYFLISA